MRVLLVGGGLSHIQLIRHLHQNPQTDLEVTLVSEPSHVFYRPAFSMVLSGELAWRQATVDLRKISMLAGVTFIQDKVTSLDTEKSLLRCQNRASLRYDVLSIDGSIGSYSALGEGDHVFYTKDYLSFFKKMDELEAGLKKLKPNPFQVGMVGGGRLAVDLSLYAFEKLKVHSPKMKWEIFEKGPHILPDIHPRLRKKLEGELKKRDVLFHTNFPVNNVKNHILHDDETKRTYDADVIVTSQNQVLPEWLTESNLVTSEQGLEANKYFISHTNHNVLIGGEITGTQNVLADAESVSQNILALAQSQRPSQVKSTVAEGYEFYDLPDESCLTIKWGFAKADEALWVERQKTLKGDIVDVRAEKDQEQAELAPTMENTEFINNLTDRLALDIEDSVLEVLFTESLDDQPVVNHWCEREYRDVYNDHFLSGYHTGLDIFDEGYSKGGFPKYLRLYVSAPRTDRDVEILSQIILGAKKATTNRCALRVHICGQAMNTVQFSLGLESQQKPTSKVEPIAYLALINHLGLYSLLSQQGKSVWEGEWLAKVWSELDGTNELLAQRLQTEADKLRCVQIGEDGLINTLIGSLGEEGWKVCLNLRKLPRWHGVDRLVKEELYDALIEQNWEKGREYWMRDDDKMPASQYLLWEPQVVRPPMCLMVDPSIARELMAEFRSESQLPITFIGFAEKTLERDKTFLKFSDWDMDMPRREVVEILRQPELRG